MPDPAVTQRLGILLAEEVARLRDFTNLLEREQELLKQHDGDALLTLVAGKNTLTHTLANLAVQRDRLLASGKYPAGRPGMEAWLAGDGAPYRPTWSALLDLAATARAANQLNGQLINLHMQHNQQALTALMAASDRATTYGPDGHTQAGLSGGRSFGKA